MKKHEQAKSVKTSRHLACILSDEEKLQYGRKLADLEDSSEQCEIEKKNAVDGFKEKQSAIDVGIRRFVAAIRDGMERREVDCEWIYHWDSFSKELSRCDTGEVIEREIIGPEERQIGLDGIDSNAKD